MKMDKLTMFIREYILIFSIVVSIIGLLLLSMGIIFYGMPDADVEFVTAIGEWNAYILVAGLIVLAIGLWYIYSFEKNKRFVLKELKTNKRSEFLKKHNEVKNTVKHLPSKYRALLEDKERELRVK
jgi:hypothetical protein